MPEVSADQQAPAASVRIIPDFQGFGAEQMKQASTNLLYQIATSVLAERNKGNAIGAENLTLNDVRQVSAWC